VTAITGSVGKTGTRHLVAACLAANGATHSSKGNYNNHIGAPMSLALMPQNSRFGVFELGMNHSGEIADLSPMVAPDVAIITRIASSHIGNFNSLDDIAAAKGEIFDGLTTGGTAILNADDDYTPMLAELARKAGAERVITCGFADSADARVDSLTHSDNGLSVKASIDGTPLSFTTQMTAPHWAISALMGLVTVKTFGGDLDASIAALAEVGDLEGRGAHHRLTISGGRQITLIDDSYNASPASMTAALESLKTDPAAGRRVAILADMLELGEASPDLHRDLLPPLRRGGVELVISFGPSMAELALAANAHDDIITCHTDNAQSAAELAKDNLRDGDVVLVKGSNGMKTHHVISALTEDAASFSPEGGANAT
ncbi:MAG: UDP-N-acetylmuramoyl-tripeptide--D-alanyl-D-alanine ligase, partial [Alphaproteobacteria bacterium]|nr:UDP-N-acetylmuramoyl-tripeptide--D-alanyl-D-alanine ligase [Alphaproteobacteria bacterium]